METTLIMLPNPILVSDDAIKVNDYYVKENQFIKCVEEEVGLANMCYPKIIAGIPELPQLDLSLVADEIGYVDVEKLADKANGYGFLGKGGDKYNAFNEGFVVGFNANPKKYTEKDIVEFLEWVGKKGYPCIDASKKGLWVLNPLDPKDYTVKELLDSWLKERQPKVYNVEVEMEYYYMSSKEFYGNDADWIKCSKDNFDSIKREIPSCPFKIEPKITNNTIKILRIL